MIIFYDNPHRGGKSKLLDEAKSRNKSILVGNLQPPETERKWPLCDETTGDYLVITEINK